LSPGKFSQPPIRSFPLWPFREEVTNMKPAKTKETGKAEPIQIRKLDKIETTSPSSHNGG
jgi:hypothetical protein